MTPTPTTGTPSRPDAATLRAHAAEHGLSVAEYVRAMRRRTEREAAWERALAELTEDSGPGNEKE